MKETPDLGMWINNVQFVILPLYVIVFSASGIKNVSVLESQFTVHLITLWNCSLLCVVLYSGDLGLN